jgi:ABC-2 type transport system ATP-binding protein
MDMKRRYVVEVDAVSKVYQRQRSLPEILRGKGRPDTQALDRVTLTINQGEVFGLLGPTGSGKTTFLKILSTILSPTSGTARVFGIDVRRHPRRVRRLVALVTAEERSFYWRLTGRQNLAFFASLYGETDRAQAGHIEELLDLFGLREAGHTRVGEYSTGMRQKLAIVRGLLSEPRLLFLDEPTRGLDPAAAHNLLELVRARAVEHFQSTVILTTHVAREVEQLCDRIATLHHGRVSYLGSVAGLTRTVAQAVVYNFTVSGLTEAVLASMRDREGVTSCTSTVRPDGAWDLEVGLAHESALSGVLRQLLWANVTVTRCQLQERSIEETFRAVFDQDIQRSASASSGSTR